MKQNNLFDFRFRNKILQKISFRKCVPQHLCDFDKVFFMRERHILNRKLINAISF